MILIIVENGMMTVMLDFHYKIVVTNISVAIIIKPFQFSYKFQWEIWSEDI